MMFEISNLIYYNIQNRMTNYLYFVLNYIYHSCIFFEKDINPFFDQK